MTSRPSGIYFTTDDLPDLPRALCIGVDPEIFFPTSDLRRTENGRRWRDQSSDARYACQACPEQAKCLGYALDHPEVVGIWGGSTDLQRKKMRKTHGAGAA